MSDLFGAALPAKGNARDSGYARNAADWYQETAACVDAFLAVEEFDGIVWDPACGGGNIPLRCEARGIPAMGSDLVDRAGGRWPVANFLDLTTAGDAVHVVTNPPFNLAQRFVEHALALVQGKVCIVQRLSFLEGQARRRFFLSSGLSRVWVHSSRQSMPPGGVDVLAKGGAVAYCWLVWDRTTQPGEMWRGGFLP